MNIRYIQIVVGEEEFKKIKRSAFEGDVTLSEWMLMAANAYLVQLQGKETVKASNKAEESIINP